MRYVFGIGIEFDKDGDLISEKNADILIEALLKEASKIFGGCFVQRGEGGWINPRGLLVVEKGITITIDLATPNRKAAKKFAEIVCNTFRQEAVIVTEIPCETWMSK